jgi:ABC-2 type transport system permease protein
MLWHKSWLDTRWRFLIPLAILSINAWGLVIEYAPVANVFTSIHVETTGTGVLGRAIREALDSERTYPGYIWYQWFRSNLLQMGTICAALLGSGNLVAGPSGSGLFTLSMPASRNRWLATRATLGLGQSFALALVPSLVIPLMSPTIGQHYDLTSAVVHAVCAFAASAVFFSLAFLLSTVFPDVPRPLLIACGVAAVIGLVESQLDWNGLFRVMSGTTYFRTGSLPWVGLLVSGLLSTSLLVAAAVNIARKDF